MTTRLNGADERAPVDDHVLDVLIVRIEKLWRKANDPAATDGEREAFETKALSLMERHRIEAAMLDIDRDDPMTDVSYGEVEGRYGRILIDLLTCVADAYDCRVWYRSWRMSYEPFVFGFRGDAKRVIAITRMLMTDAMQRASLVRRGTPAATYEYRRAFLYGFVSAASERLAAAQRMAADSAASQHGPDATSACLVLVDRGEQVEHAYREKRLRRARPTRRVVADGYDDGRRAGAEAGLCDRPRIIRRRALSTRS